MGKFFEIVHPSFVLRNSLYASILIGAFVPVVGVLLVVGRRSMLALALPQVSKLGVAGVIVLCAVSGIDFGHESGWTFFAYALFGAAASMSVALFGLWFIEWNGNQSVDSSTAAIYVFAGASTTLIAASNLVPELGLLNILKGEILAVPDTALVALVVGFLVVGATLFIFSCPLKFLLFDKWLALSSGLPAWGLTALLLALVCVTIALGSLVCDPLAIFAFLILPPLTILPFVVRMRALFVASACLGCISAFAGFYVSYAMENWNFPTSATQIVILGIAWLCSIPASYVVKRN